MPDIRVQDEQGVMHVFPDGSTPQMIAKAMGAKLPGQISKALPTAPAATQTDLNNMYPQSFNESVEARRARGELQPITGNERGAGAAVGHDILGLLKGFPSLIPGVGEAQHAIQAFQTGRATSTTPEGVQNAAEKQAGYGLGYRMAAAVAPGIGMNVPSIEQAAARGDTSGVAGHMVVPGLLATSPLIAEGLSKASPKLTDLASKPSGPVYAPPIPPGLSDAANARLQDPFARAGHEALFKGISPSASNPNLREKLAIAGPDLKAIEKENPLGVATDLQGNKVKGGIIDPDFRHRQLAENIKTYSNKLYTTHDKLLDAIGDTPNKTFPELANFDDATIKGITRKLGSQLPPPNRTLTIKQSYDLMHATNDYLRPLMGKTAEAQRLALSTNPILSSLKDFSDNLHQSIYGAADRVGNGMLGDTLRDMDMRYGALSDVRRGILQQANNVEKMTATAGLRGYVGRKSIGAHESLGRILNSQGGQLQKGMEALAKSDLNPQIERVANFLTKPKMKALPPASGEANPFPSPGAPIGRLPIELRTKPPEAPGIIQGTGPLGKRVIRLGPVPGSHVEIPTPPTSEESHIPTPLPKAPPKDISNSALTKEDLMRRVEELQKLFK